MILRQHSSNPKAYVNSETGETVFTVSTGAEDIARKIMNAFNTYGIIVSNLRDAAAMLDQIADKGQE